MTTVDDWIADGCRLDDLQISGLKILQHPERYRFTTDPVLLANFCKVTPSTRVLDLGSGSGILGILLVGKYGAKSVDGIEIQPYLAGMSRASVEYNRLSRKIRIECGDARNAAGLCGVGRYDLVVSNPPYMRADDGVHSADDDRAIARHEVKLTLAELIRSAAGAVKYGGHVCLVHKTERLAEVCAVMAAENIAPKRIRLIEGRRGLAPTLFLMDAVKAGGVGLRFLPNLTLSERDGTETEELRRIYCRGAASDDHPSGVCGTADIGAQENGKPNVKEKP